MTRIAKPALTLSLLTSLILASTAPTTASAGKAKFKNLNMVKYVDTSTTVQPRAGSQTIGQK